MRSQVPLFADEEHFVSLALWLMRDGTEYPGAERRLAVHIPAILAWMSIVGAEIYALNIICNRGTPGTLWSGKRRFCRERWQFWKPRFVELSKSDELGEDLKTSAGEVLVKMDEAETRAAEMGLV